MAVFIAIAAISIGLTLYENYLISGLERGAVIQMPYSANESGCATLEFHQ
jgi:hypothetical protein